MDTDQAMNTDPFYPSPSPPLSLRRSVSLPSLPTSPHVSPPLSRAMSPMFDNAADTVAPPPLSTNSSSSTTATVTTATTAATATPGPLSQRTSIRVNTALPPFTTLSDAKSNTGGRYNRSPRSIITPASSTRTTASYVSSSSYESTVPTSFHGSDEEGDADCEDERDDGLWGTEIVESHFLQINGILPKTKLGELKAAIYVGMGIKVPQSTPQHPDPNPKTTDNDSSSFFSSSQQTPNPTPQCTRSAAHTRTPSSTSNSSSSSVSYSTSTTSSEHDLEYWQPIKAVWSKHLEAGMVVVAFYHIDDAETARRACLRGDVKLRSSDVVDGDNESALTCRLVDAGEVAQMVAPEGTQLVLDIARLLAVTCRPLAAAGQEEEATKEETEKTQNASIPRRQLLDLLSAGLHTDRPTVVRALKNGDGSTTYIVRYKDVRSRDLASHNIAGCVVESWGVTMEARLVDPGYGRVRAGGWAPSFERMEGAQTDLKNISLMEELDAALAGSPLDGSGSSPSSLSSSPSPSLLVSQALDTASTGSIPPSSPSSNWSASGSAKEDEGETDSSETDSAIVVLNPRSVQLHHRRASSPPLAIYVPPSSNPQAHLVPVEDRKVDGVKDIDVIATPPSYVASYPQPQYPSQPQSLPQPQPQPQHHVQPQLQPQAQWTPPMPLATSPPPLALSMAHALPHMNQWIPMPMSPPPPLPLSMGVQGMGYVSPTLDYATPTSPVLGGMGPISAMGGAMGGGVGVGGPMMPFPPPPPGPPEQIWSGVPGIPGMESVFAGQPQHPLHHQAQNSLHQLGNPIQQHSPYGFQEPMSPTLNPSFFWSPSMPMPLSPTLVHALPHGHGQVQSPVMGYMHPQAQYAGQMGGQGVDGMAIDGSGAGVGYPYGNSTLGNDTQTSSSLSQSPSATNLTANTSSPSTTSPTRSTMSGSERLQSYAMDLIEMRRTLAARGHSADTKNDLDAASQGDGFKDGDDASILLPSLRRTKTRRSLKVGLEDAGIEGGMQLHRRLARLHSSNPFSSDAISNPLHALPGSNSTNLLGSPNGITPEKNILDLERIREGLDTRTTVMIKNIPNKLTREDLCGVIWDVCPRGVDFVYLRIDFTNGCNVGYAFVNFLSPGDVLEFAEKKLEKKWNMYSSEKVLQMTYANYQGKEALIEKFRNSSIMDERATWRPVIFYSSGPQQGMEEPFPEPTHLRRKERSAVNRGTLYSAANRGMGMGGYGGHGRGGGSGQRHGSQFVEKGCFGGGRNVVPGLQGSLVQCL